MRALPVLNVQAMETQVDNATNDEPWTGKGADLIFELLVNGVVKTKFRIHSLEDQELINLTTTFGQQSVTVPKSKFEDWELDIPDDFVVLVKKDYIVTLKLNAGRLESYAAVEDYPGAATTSNISLEFEAEFSVTLQQHNPGLGGGQRN